MPAGQTYRLIRAQRQQKPLGDPNLLGLQLTDQDVSFRPVPITTPYAIRKSRASWQQFVPKDMTGLQLPDADQTLTLPPWTDGTAPLLIRRSRAAYQQYRPTDFSQFNLPDQDVNLLPPWADGAAPYLIRRPRPQWQQYRPTDPSSLELPDQDVTLVPPPQPASWQRYRGRPVWAQWPVYSRLDPTGLELPDSDPTLVFVPPPTWRRTPSPAFWHQYTPIDPNEFNVVLPDQDVNLVSSTVWQAWVAFRRGRQQFQQFFPPYLPGEPVVAPQPTGFFRQYRVYLDAEGRVRVFTEDEEAIALALLFLL